MHGVLNLVLKNVRNKIKQGCIMDSPNEQGACCIKHCIIKALTIELISKSIIYTYILMQVVQYKYNHLHE